MSEEQQAVREVVRDLVQRSEPADRSGYGGVWARLEELGLTGVGVPEEQGGSGGGLEDLLVVVDELARAGARVPLAEYHAASYVVGAGGERVTAVRAAVEVVAGRVSAAFPAVAGAGRAAILVVVAPARAPLVVDLMEASVQVTEGRSVDGSPVGDVVLDATPVRVADTTDALAERLELALLTDLVGAAHGAYALTKAYLAQREQFGAPLIDIPAVRLRLACVRVDLSEAEAALLRAVRTFARGASDDPALPFAVLAARRTVARLCATAWETTHQLHGAIGVTEEYPLHHFTSALLAGRDRHVSEAEALTGLGELVLAGGEEALWSTMTPPTVG